MSGDPDWDRERPAVACEAGPKSLEERIVSSGAEERRQLAEYWSRKREEQPMSDKPSPGPWTWGVQGDGGEVLLQDSLHDANRGPLGIYSEGRGAKPVNLVLIAKAPELASMIRELEWSYPGGEYSDDPMWCPVCSEAQNSGHAPDCRLAALLSELT
jgi:hypothetical protein